MRLSSLGFIRFRLNHLGHGLGNALLNFFGCHAFDVRAIVESRLDFLLGTAIRAIGNEFDGLGSEVRANSEAAESLLLGSWRFVSCRELAHIDWGRGLTVAGSPKTLDRLSVRCEISHRLSTDDDRSGQFHVPGSPFARLVQLLSCLYFLSLCPRSYERFRH
jgi:hypothetical protein